MINNSTFIACFDNGNFYSRELKEDDTTVYDDIELNEFSSLKRCNEFLNVAETVYYDAQIEFLKDSQ